MNTTSRHSPMIVEFLDFTPQHRRGMEAFYLGLAEKLVQRGCRVAFVLSGEPVDWFREKLVQWNVPYCTVSFPLNFQQFRRAYRFLLPLKPTLLQTFYISPFNLYIHLLRFLLRVRYLVNTDHSSGTVSDKSRLGETLAQIRGTLAGRFFDKIITISDFQTERDTTRAYLPKSKFTKIYSGPDMNRYVPRPELRPTSYIKIAFAGQIRPQKGVLTLIKAFAEASKQGNQPLELHIAGVGPQTDELKEFAKVHQLGQVRFLGGVDNIPELFASAHIVVVPSEWAEAFGLVVVEAMACGTAVICSDAGGIPEVLGADGGTGLIFHKGDVADLAEKLVRLITNPDRREQMGRLGRDRATAVFSKDQMVNGYVEVIQQVTNHT